MGISDILSLLGGLALFLYGMQMMSNGLEMAAGNKMKEILEKLTANRFVGVLVGALITAVIQSSSATTVMVVGFVNSGLMSLNQAVWIIMGANIGTTITGQLIALDIDMIAPILAFVGVACITFVKNERARHIAAIFAGLGVLFIGMDMMSGAMSPLRDSELFMNFMSTVSNPLIGIAIGAVFTAVIQSSSAAVGILQALASTGIVPLSTAVFMLFGSNIGTCITAVLAAIGTKPAAKRTTVIHLMFNVIGSVIFTAICLLTPFISWMEMLTADPVAQIANTHTIFNIVTTIVLLPFGNYMAMAATKILPETADEKEGQQRLLYITPFEISQIADHATMVITPLEKEISRMLDKAKDNVRLCYDAVINEDANILEEVKVQEEYIDYLNAEIAKYIIRLMPVDMSEHNKTVINSYYMILGNIERIGDHALNIAEYVLSMKKWNIKMPEHASEGLRKMQQSNIEMMDALDISNATSGYRLLKDISEKEKENDELQKKYLQIQIEHAKDGDGSAEAGILLSEILTDYERIGDYALNIAKLYQKTC